MKWQPIETAPRDGTRVELWVCSNDGRQLREREAWWENGKWMCYAYNYEDTDEVESRHVDGHKLWTATQWLPIVPDPAGSDAMKGADSWTIENCELINCTFMGEPITNRYIAWACSCGHASRAEHEAAKTVSATPE